MLRLLVAVLLTSFQLFHHGHQSRSNVMYKMDIRNKHALCNDRSRAAYYLGVSQNLSKWIIFLESGSYCLTKGQCNARFGSKITNALMTSKDMPSAITGRDLLSANSNANPLFYEFSRVLIPYCSSDSWLGTQIQSNVSSLQNNSAIKQFVFSGKIIFQSVILELLSQDFSRVRELVLVGSSAGAIGVLNHIEWLKTLLSSRNIVAKLSVIIDGGWFINFQESIASKITKEFYSISKPLSRACADITYGFPCCLSSPCMLAQGYYPSDVPTLFVSAMFDIYIIGDAILRYMNKVSMAENGASDLLTMIDLYGGAMNQSLLVTNSPNVSFFVPACFQHTFFSMSSLREKGAVLHYSRVFTQGNAVFSISKNPGTWLSTAITRGNKTISLQSTLLTWAKASDQSVRVIDSCLGVMCNPTCPDKLAFVDTAVHWSEVPNGMVVFLSLLVTVVCVVVKSSFVVQSALLARARRRYLESQESLKTSVYEPAETITILYSTPDASKHFHFLGNSEGMKQNNTNKRPSLEGEQLAHDYTAKGYNAMFYRTVQYLRMAFRANTESHGDKETHSQLNLKKSDFHTKQDHSEKFKENVNAVHLEKSVKGSSNDQKGMKFNISRDCPTRGIHNAKLSFKQGELVAIVGKHRAGKTTSLKLLSGRLVCGCGQEHLLVDGVGQEKIRDRYASKTVYLSQFTLPCYGELTVKQYLTLVALMRVPRNMSDTVELVEQIICEMKLTSVAAKTFDGSYNKNFTELQKRLICVALQLINRPLAIFLDEPIAGLNPASSMDMLNSLRRLCDRGHLVIITTQSIPRKTAELFNQLVLLSDKQVIYSGDAGRLAEHYRDVSRDRYEGKKCLEDVILDILQSKTLIEAMMAKESFKTIEVTDANRPDNKERNIMPTSQNSTDTTKLFTRLFVIDYRASLSWTLGQSLYLPIMFSIFGITAGIVYWQAKTPLLIITAYCGSSMPSLLFLSSLLLNRINRSLEIRQLDSAEDVGYSYEHLIHTFLNTSAACVLPVLGCSAMTYFMVMTSYNWWRFVLVTVISLVLNQTWVAVYMMIIYANPSNACHAGLVVAILAGFAGGFIVTKQQMPIGYNLLFYINPQLYGYSAITKVLLQDIRLPCEYESILNCISTDGNAVLARFYFDSVNPYENLMIMLCMTLLSLLFSWLLCDAKTSR